jgi:preprotein translocase subunit SecD
MKTVTEQLKDADPLGYEPVRSAQARRTSRRNLILALPAEVLKPSSRRRVLIAAAITIAGVAAGAGYWARGAVDVVAAVRFEARLAEENPGDGLREVVVSGSRKIYLHEDAVVTNSDIAGARLVAGDAPTSFSVAVTFTAGGAQKMSRASASHVGKPLAILLDGEVVMAPVIRSPMSSSAVITGTFTRAEAERIVAGIIGK